MLFLRLSWEPGGGSRGVLLGINLPLNERRPEGKRGILPRWARRVCTPVERHGSPGQERAVVGCEWLCWWLVTADW